MCKLYLQFIRFVPLPISVCLGCHNKLPQNGWLKQQELLTVLEVRDDQGAGTVGSGKSSFPCLQEHGRQRETLRTLGLLMSGTGVSLSLIT